jgi:hypothetical protein
MTEERIYSRAREQSPSRVPVQNMDVDEEDDIQDEININMDKIDDAIDIEEIVKE